MADVLRDVLTISFRLESNSFPPVLFTGTQAGLHAGVVFGRFSRKQKEKRDERKSVKGKGYAA